MKIEYTPELAIELKEKYEIDVEAELDELEKILKDILKEDYNREE